MNSVNSSVLFHLSHIQKVKMGNRPARGLINLKQHFGGGVVSARRFPFLDLPSRFSLDTINREKYVLSASKRNPNVFPYKIPLHIIISIC